MDYLVAEVAREAQIPKPIARIAVLACIKRLKEMVPGPFRQLLDRLLGVPSGSPVPQERDEASLASEAEGALRKDPQDDETRAANAPHGFVQSLIERMTDRETGSATPTDEILKQREAKEKENKGLFGGWA
eukprot:tig00000310_g23966.t1